MRQRRNVLLVNRKFQLKYSFYVVSWIFVLSLVYPYITYNLFEFFESFAQVNAPGPAVDSLRVIQREFLGLMVLFHIVFILVIFLISLFMSHKIAGPVYKLRKAFSDAREGRYDHAVHFRKADNFNELAADFNDMMKNVQGRLDRQSQAVTKAIQQVEGSVAESEPKVRDKLEEALTEMRKVRDQV